MISCGLYIYVLLIYVFLSFTTHGLDRQIQRCAQEHDRIFRLKKTAKDSEGQSNSISIRENETTITNQYLSNT